MFIFPGRVLCKDIETARELIIAKILSRGFTPLEVPAPFPCPVQCWDDGIWWEYYTKVEIPEVTPCATL